MSSSESTNLKQQSGNLLWSEELNNFLMSLDNYEPTIPEAISSFYLRRSGLEVKDSKVSKLVSLASDKFLAELIAEAKQISQVRQQGVRAQKRKAEMNETLEMEDVELSLSRHHINTLKQRFKLGE